jgi:molybdenum cofactor synthesis domain-containing protein
MPSPASPARPTAALVIVGAEVLSAKVDDANSPWLLAALRARGVEVLEIRTIGDDVGLIAAAVSALAREADHVFTTGGIGPTHDDVTIAGVAAAFGVPIVRHPLIEEQLRRRIGPALNAAHLKMADVPDGASVLLDDDALLPVVRMRNVTIFPGVPSLMRWSFERIAAELHGAPFYTHALLLTTHESSFAERLAAVQAAHPAVAIGSYPRIEPEELRTARRATGDERRVRVRVTVDGRELPVVEAAMAAVRAAMQPEWIVGEEKSVIGE